MDFSLPEDLKMLQSLARDLVKDQLLPLERELLGREADLEGARRDLPAEKEAGLVKMAKEMGLWGLSLPEDLGGAGLGLLASCLVEEELAKTVIPFRLGDITPLLFDCNAEQKQDYLLPALEGRKSFILALAESGQPADPASLEMTARKSDGSYVLNGQKLAFAGNRQADFAIVFAVTDPGKGIREGVSCFLVDAGLPGFTVSVSGAKAGWQSQAQVAEPLSLVFENCRVAASKILGEAGRAFHLGAQYLPARRVVRAARCVGAAARLLKVSLQHAQSWQSYGKTLAGWPHIQRYLAAMETDIQAARLLVYQAAWKADSGLDYRREAVMAKLFATEMLERVAGQAVMVKGGPAPAGELPLEILCRSLLASHISGRSLEVQKAFIAGELLK